jgi:hypothetical protein
MYITGVFDIMRIKEIFNIHYRGLYVFYLVRFSVVMKTVTRYTLYILHSIQFSMCSMSVHCII